MSEENDKEQSGENNTSTGSENKGGDNKSSGQNNKPSNNQGDTSKKKDVLFKSKKMNAKVFSETIGLNDRSKYWVNKKFDKTTIKTAGQWADIFIKEGVIHEKPSILDQKVNTSN